MTSAFCVAILLFIFPHGHTSAGSIRDVESCIEKEQSDLVSEKTTRTRCIRKHEEHISGDVLHADFSNNRPVLVNSSVHHVVTRIEADAVGVSKVDGFREVKFTFDGWVEPNWKVDVPNLLALGTVLDRRDRTRPGFRASEIKRACVEADYSLAVDDRRCFRVDMNVWGVRF